MPKVLMSFTFRKGWHICFFDYNRRRSRGRPYRRRS
jgi:hypothetical protein